MVRHVTENSLRYHVYRGSQRKRHDAAFLGGFDVVLTTYDTVRADYVPPDSDATGKRKGMIQSINWHRVVLDEGMCV